MTDEEMKEEELKLKEQREKNLEVIKKYVADKKLPEPRPLTRNERKRLDAAGVNLYKIKADDKRSLAEVKDDLADWILDNIYPNFDFENVPNHISSWFGQYVFAITYRDDLAAKNL